MTRKAATMEKTAITRTRAAAKKSKGRRPKLVHFTFESEVEHKQLHISSNVSNFFFLFLSETVTEPPPAATPPTATPLVTPLICRRPRKAILSSPSLDELTKKWEAKRFPCSAEIVLRVRLNMSHVLNVYCFL